MRETTEYKKLQGTQQLIHVPCKHWKKMSLVETRVIKRSSGGCESQGPSAVVQGPQRGKPPDTWDKLQDREQRAFTCLNWDTFPKVNLKWTIQQCSGSVHVPSPALQELGWNRTWGAQASFSNYFLLGVSTNSPVHLQGHAAVTSHVTSWPLSGHQQRAVVPASDGGEVSVRYQFL